MSRTIKVLYNPQETGPVELLRGDIGRVVDHVLLSNDLWRGDIVRLEREPVASEQGFPAIAEVLWSRFPHKTTIIIREQADAILLATVCAVSGAELAMVVSPTDESPGFVRIGHHDCFDPNGLAIALGIDQTESVPPQTAPAGKPKLGEKT